jgi:hypothetical protein
MAERNLVVDAGDGTHMWLYNVPSVSEGNLLRRRWDERLSGFERMMLSGEHMVWQFSLFSSKQILSRRRKERIT